MLALAFVALAVGCGDGSGEEGGASPTPIGGAPEATLAPEETQLAAPESIQLETLRSEIRSIVPSTDLSGLDSFRELQEHVSDEFPIITEHYLIQPAGDIAEAPILPVEVQMKKPGGWREQDKDIYRDWQEATLQEVAEIRHLSGEDCRLFLFTTPHSPSDTMTFAGIDRKLSCPAL
jgi:hypothetical protein